MSQLQTQKLMTSQQRSHIECLIRTYNILVRILLKIECSRNGGFQYAWMMIFDSGLLFWATV